jgi:NADP-dependent alcohol dehydrogenase
MQDFEFHNPTKIIFGKNSLNSLAAEAGKLGKKVLLTYGQGSIKKNGVYDQVMAQLTGFEVQEFAGIEPNPRVETLRKAIAQAREFAPDLILAVGGGSVIDGSKLIAAATYYDGDAWHFLTKPGIEPQKYIPLATVLTLSATNSEMNSGAVITNWETHEKLFFEREQCYPVFSILNPEFTFSLPQEQIAYGVIDPFVHVIEQYINQTLDAGLQDRWAEGALLNLIEHGPQAIAEPKSYEHRAELMLSGCFVLNGILAMGTGQDWATHNIEHEVSAFYDITHAAGLAVILPNWLEVVAKQQKPEKLLQYGQRVWGLSGSEAEVMDGAIAKTREFFENLGVKTRLSDYNIDSKYFHTMVERLAVRGIGEVPLTAEQIREILEKSL